MTPDASPPLQFETAIPQEGAADAAARPDGVSCRNCARPIADEYFDLNGLPVCGPCRDGSPQFTITGPFRVAAGGKTAT